MVVLTLLVLLLGYNLVEIIMDRSTPFYKDIRFYLVMLSLAVLVITGAQRYLGS